MKASEVKKMYEFKNPNGYFFTRNNMSFFGDTMANFGVADYDENSWHLYRKKTTSKSGNYVGSGWLFDKKTFKVTPIP
jgi:hypothetical protein